MALGACLFALMNFFARLASATAPWPMVGGVRALIGAAVAVAVAKARGASLVTHERRAVLLRSLFGTAAMVCTFYALTSPALSLGDTVTLLNLAPVFLALLAPMVLREKTSPASALAIALALAGVVLVVRPAALFGGAEGGAPGAGTTAAVAVLAAFFTSIAMMLLRRIGPRETPESVAFHFSLFAALVMGAIGASDLRVPEARDAACMVAAGLCAGFAQLAMTRAYALERAARVSAMSYLAVVVSALLGAAVLGESPTATALVGMGLVVVGGVVVTFAREPRNAPRAPIAPTIAQPADIVADVRPPGSADGKGLS
jgi:drug/metabolite transporter (DMT)-like permease